MPRAWNDPDRRFLDWVIRMAIIPVQIGNLTYYAAESISASHGFTTRLGGVSRDVLESLNIGTRRGDSPENVVKNYEILGSALGFDPRKAVLTRQTHTDIVRRVGKAQHGAGLFAPDLPECDALITDEPGTALVVFTADCTPILLHDPVTGAVGAVHAGWRGTVSAIAAKTVREMVSAFGCRESDIRAAIGPNIGQCCFETGADVPGALISALGDAVTAYIQPAGEKFYVDLKGVNAMLLRRAGVEHVEQSTLCTACRTDLFWSHRRFGARRGSQGAVIVCGEDAA